jgi:ABC-type nitrate/sulfonate/bicarbonate transport system permease component
MKTLISLEELALTAAAIYFLWQHSLGLSVWIWIPLFFSPDISMLGYVFGNRIGAICYNLFHHRGVALCIASAGYFLASELTLAIGILLFAHSSFDRIMGYGLKYFSGFTDTHLGTIGRPKSKQGQAV